MGGVGYKGSQGLAELSHTGSQTNQDTGRLSESQSILHLQSTLVLANSTLALSQPVRNSFAIVKGKEGLAGVGMKIDPYGKNQSKAQSSWISPAVLVDMPNYQLRNITIEPINPPLGVTPEDMTFPLLSTYKSGFLLELGKERTIFAIGRLVDNQQVPLANMPIEIRRIDDLDNLEEKLVSTFTSRTGRFQMPEIKPGYYEIRPTSATQLGSVIVDIVETDKDIYRLGDLVVQP
jgi:outer membrane usher protein